MSIIGPYSALDIINDAAQTLGVVGPSGMVNADDANSCLRSLNLMLSGWSTDGISARAYVTETFPITGNRTYTWGTTGTPDWNSKRPTRVITADLKYINNGDLLVPMEVIGSNQYQGYGDSLIVTGPPKLIFPDMLMPNAVMYLYPIPDQAYSIIITSDKALSGMTSLNTPFSFDDIYYQPMVFNLACFIAPKFGKKVGMQNDPKSIAGLAAKSYASLINITSPDMFFSSDYKSQRSGLNAPVLDGGYNQ